jgi:hypothetical protein
MQRRGKETMRKYHLMIRQFTGRLIIRFMLTGD